MPDPLNHTQHPWEMHLHFVTTVILHLPPVQLQLLEGDDNELASVS